MNKILGCFFILAILLTACSSNSEKHSSAKSNENFLKEDLDVALWQERFENRDRDVYKNRDKIIAALGLTKGQAVADIGAGTGFFLKPIFDQVKGQGKIFAVDISPKFVSFLKARGKSESISNLIVVKGTNTSSNLKDNSIDLIFVCNTYHHFDNKDKMLQDFKRILKPNGELVIVDFDLAKKNDSWVAKHLDQSKGEIILEISKSFKYLKESNIGLSENFMIHFKKGLE